MTWHSHNGSLVSSIPFLSLSNNDFLLTPHAVLRQLLTRAGRNTAQLNKVLKIQQKCLLSVWCSPISKQSVLLCHSLTFIFPFCVRNRIKSKKSFQIVKKWILYRPKPYYSCVFDGNSHLHDSNIIEPFFSHIQSFPTENCQQ